MKLLSRVSIAVTAIGSLLVFTWPLLISAEQADQSNFAQAIFIVLMPVLLLLIAIEFASGSIEVKQLAVLGVLIALNAVIRTLGAGTGGIETAFFVIIIGAYALGSGFGFILGAGSLFVSALLTGGIGPWLPFQMMAAGLVGMGAGALPKLRRNWQRMSALLVYSIIAAFVYGALMTMWTWPFLAGVGGPISYLAGAPILENMGRFIAYELITGGLLWDLGRAVTTCVLVLLTAKALLATLERAASRAGVQRL